jgi:hypothetical protein
VSPRAGLDNGEKRKFLTLPGLELRPLGHPSRSQSLYRLRYPGPTANSRKLKRYDLRLPITAKVRTRFCENQSTVIELVIVGSAETRRKRSSLISSETTFVSRQRQRN